jgi:Arc/MetJ-type ribon-helix-helix transcriptional regulator
MKNTTILVSLSDEERAFIVSKIAAGNYSDEADVIHAALAAFMDKAGFSGSARSAFGAREGGFGFSEPDIDSFAGAGEDLRHHLSRSEGSGVSDREIPAIIRSVKAKLRADGAL